MARQNSCAFLLPFPPATSISLAIVLLGAALGLRGFCAGLRGGNLESFSRFGLVGSKAGGMVNDSMRVSMAEPGMAYTGLGKVAEGVGRDIASTQAHITGHYVQQLGLRNQLVNVSHMVH